MKRIVLVILALALYLSITTAFASDVSVNVDTGDCSPVNININSIDGCNNDAVIGVPSPAAPSCSPICVRSPRAPSCVIIDGVPSCIEPPNYCGTPDPDYCARMARHSCLKNAARDVFGYLEGRLRSIGWWHKNYKFIWSYETRVIYGSRGDNNHYSDRRPIVFYCVEDPSIKVTAYVNVYKHGKDYITLFSIDFTPAKKCSKSSYTYADELMITGAYADGYDAVDEFIAYLQSLSGCDADEGAECDCTFDRR